MGSGEVSSTFRFALQLSSTVDTRPLLKPNLLDLPFSSMDSDASALSIRSPEGESDFHATRGGRSKTNPFLSMRPFSLR